MHFTHNFTYICLTPRLLYHPLQQLKSFSHISQHPHMSPFHYMLMPRSLHRGRTPVAPERVVLSSHRLNKEAKSMKNGLSKSHPSKLGMLSSAFIHFCDLSSIWHLVSLAGIFFRESWHWISVTKAGIALTTCNKRRVTFWNYQALLPNKKWIVNEFAPPLNLKRSQFLCNWYKPTTLLHKVLAARNSSEEEQKNFRCVLLSLVSTKTIRPFRTALLILACAR